MPCSPGLVEDVRQCAGGALCKGCCLLQQAMLLRREAAATLDTFADSSAASSFSTVKYRIAVTVRLAGAFFAWASHRWDLALPFKFQGPVLSSGHDRGPRMVRSLVADIEERLSAALAGPTFELPTPAQSNWR